ncbi:MAG: LysR family transcriptional regulator [Deltaproteobacteria bacterium]|nr:MAG: LysR family transcriptional regulator [Deltaproteobacteria bacterium]
MINLNQLRVFHEAAKCQNFSEAARNLCVTQPAVTGQIRSLEESLEIRLFKKRGRKMLLSEAGAVLFSLATKVFDLEQEMEQVIAEMHELKRGILKVGTTKTYARYLMPSLISKFRKKHPDIKVILDEGSSMEITSSLLDLRNELAVVAAHEEIPGISTIPFREEPVRLVVANEHPFAKKGTIEFSELAGQFIILKEQQSSTHQIVQEAFTEHGLTPNVLVETSNVEFIKETVERGEGVAFLVWSSIEKEINAQKLKAIEIKGCHLSLQVVICFLEEGGLSPAAKAFLNILKEACETA